MKLENPLKANDWGISSFFKFIASLQLAVWVVLGLSAVGVQIPILREVLAAHLPPLRAGHHPPPRSQIAPPQYY